MKFCFFEFMVTLFCHLPTLQNAGSLLSSTDLQDTCSHSRITFLHGLLPSATHILWLWFQASSVSTWTQMPLQPWFQVYDFLIKKFPSPHSMVASLPNLFLAIPCLPIYISNLPLFWSCCKCHIFLMYIPLSRSRINITLRDQKASFYPMFLDFRGSSLVHLLYKLWPWNEEAKWDPSQMSQSLLPWPPPPPSLIIVYSREWNHDSFEKSSRNKGSLKPAMCSTWEGVMEWEWTWRVRVLHTCARSPSCAVGRSWGKKKRGFAQACLHNLVTKLYVGELV